MLAAALAVRAPRIGHVLVDLATIRDIATVDTDEPVDLSELPWPEPEDWMGRVAASGLVAIGEDTVEPNRPLRLVGTWLYLDRYWREEREVAADLRALSQAPADEIDVDLLADGLSRLFPGETDRRQSLAAAIAVVRRLAVVAGGPGTGKTTTVARIVALLAEQAEGAGSAPPLVGLAAPTGKAAARLQEAVHEEATKLADRRADPRPPPRPERLNPPPPPRLAPRDRQPLPLPPGPAPPPRRRDRRRDLDGLAVPDGPPPRSRPPRRPPDPGGRPRPARLDRGRRRLGRHRRPGRRTGCS